MSEAKPAQERQYDVVLFGATGFTGRLVAEYLAKHHAGSLRWAIAGRSEGKLLALRQDLAEIAPALESLDVLIADSGDLAALEAIAKKARVVATTVGPFARHGLPLVEACAKNGTHYADITGEVAFMRESIDRFDAVAKGTGARIVHTCGFDSIPSDLGVFVLSEHLKERRGATLAKADALVGPVKGGFSGGTMASMLLFFEQAKSDPALFRLAGDPYALNPSREADRGSDKNERVDVRLDAKTGEWVGPFVMAAVNTRVVRRTNAVAGFPYGREFRYREESCYGKGPAGFARAVATTAGVGAFALAASTDTGRKLVAPRLPAPGEGPSKAERDAGFFRVRIFGEGAGGKDAARAMVTIQGTSDPGYGETAKMLAESAVTLAEGFNLPARAGVLTPATAMGMALVNRLVGAGMSFNVADR